MDVIKSRRKTLSLSLDKNGEPIVRAPLGATKAQIDAFVKKYEGWIEQRRAERAAAPRLTLADGERVELFGKQYCIASGGRARIYKDVVFLPQEGRERAFLRLVKRLAQEKMSELTRALAARASLSYSAVRISSARSRWGSCNRQGVISYSLRIAFLPTELTEYIAVHELCHTLYFDHQKAFWQAVEGVLPDWKIRRRMLRKYEYVMQFLPSDP